MREGVPMNNVLRVFGSCLALLLLTSCTPETTADGRQGAFAGFMVLRGGAEQYGFHSDDTLEERTRGDIPLPVLESSDTATENQGLNPSCTRYFGSGPYVVFVDLSCTYPPPHSHYWAYMVFTPDGEAILVPSHTFSEVVKGMCPIIRDESGQSLVPCASSDQAPPAEEPDT
jgi:hypothetical protein